MNEPNYDDPLLKAKAEFTQAKQELKSSIKNLHDEMVVFIKQSDRDILKGYRKHSNILLVAQIIILLVMYYYCFISQSPLQALYWVTITISFFAGIIYRELVWMRIRKK